MDLTTIARVKKILAGGRSQSMSNEQDVFLGQLITAISALVEADLDRYVEQKERIEYHDVRFPGQEVFNLRAYPIDTGETFEVKYDWFRGFGATITALTINDDFALDDLAGVMTIDDYSLGRARARALRVTYTGGMATNTTNFITAFPDLANAVDLQVAFLYQRRNQLGLTGTSQEGGSVSFQAPIKWLPIVKLAIDKNRNIKSG